MSSTEICSIGISVIEPSFRRCAIRGARSTRDLKSRSARATAKSSRTLPPAYITATTIAARCSPSTSAADIETKAIASTPTRPARKSRMIETKRPATTGAAADAQIQPDKPSRPRVQATKPNTRPASATTMRARLRNRSVSIHPVQSGRYKKPDWLVTMPWTEVHPPARGMPCRTSHQPTQGDRARPSRRAHFRQRR